MHTSLDTPRRTSRLTIGLAITLTIAILVALWALRSRTDTATAPPAADQTAQAATTGNTVQEQEDAIAMAPMPRATGDNLPQREAASTTAAILLPKAVKAGPAAVPTGFPKTPEGAVAQLKAIDETAFVNMSPSNARAVFLSWVTGDDGTFYASAWTPGQNINNFTAANPSIPDGAAVASYAATQGLVKGAADDGNFVVACVLGELRYSYAGGKATRLGGADCARMAWTDGRWVVQAKPVADPTMTWPHSAESYRTGFKDLQAASS